MAWPSSRMACIADTRQLFADSRVQDLAHADSFLDGIAELLVERPNNQTPAFVNQIILTAFSALPSGSDSPERRSPVDEPFLHASAELSAMRVDPLRDALWMNP
jgi:hypothetical protein